MSDQYFLKSRRIGFRTWSLNDLSLAFELWGDSEVTRYIGGDLTNSQIQEKLLIERSISRRHNVELWPIFLLDTHEFIGCCGLRPYRVHEKSYEIGVHIKSSCWDNGYANESVLTVIEYAFDHLLANLIVANHHPDHKIAKGLISKLGFRYAFNELNDVTKLVHPCHLL